MLVLWLYLLYSPLSSCAIMWLLLFVHLVVCECFDCILFSFATLDNGEEEEAVTGFIGEELDHLILLKTRTNQDTGKPISKLAPLLFSTYIVPVFNYGFPKEKLILLLWIYYHNYIYYYITTDSHKILASANPKRTLPLYHL